MRYLRKNAFLYAWFIALGGCWLSFYFREILDMEPCPLCWYQRLAIFPIALLLGMGLYRGDAKIIVYLYPFTIFGFLVATYQVLGTYFPILLHAGLCGQSVHCTSVIHSFFGVLTLPMLSGLGFAAITLLLFWGSKKSH